MAKSKAKPSTAVIPVVVEGTCSWFSGRKGYGFLSAPGVDEGIFVHFSNLENDEDGLPILPLNDGGRVRFSYEPSKRPNKKDGLQVVKGTKVEVIDRFVPKPRKERD